MKKRKLLLINPLNTRTKGNQFNSRSVPAPLGLVVIAAVTPQNWNVEVIDENIEEFKMKDADVVGITALTSQVSRAYEISEMYRREGITTVIGGIHASMMPQEASQYFDIVVTGEAEKIWPRVIYDIDQTDYNQIYHGGISSLKDLPIPRRDLLHTDYDFAVVQTTRGCPIQCEFCSVHTFNGTKYRVRPVKDVLDEIESIPQKKLQNTYDNLIGYSKRSKQRAIELFKGMIDRGIEKDWGCQVSINFAEDDEVLKYASEAGCRLVLIGIESEVTEELQEIKKDVNLKLGVKNYKTSFEKIHDYGIGITGTFMYGFDEDTPEAMEKRTDFIINSSLDSYQATIYTPLPGTALFDRIEKDNRLLFTNYPEDWKRYNCLETVIKPNKMGADELTERMLSNWGQMYNKKVLYRKLLKSIKNTGNLKAALWSFISNIDRHNIVFFSHDRDLYDYNEMMQGVAYKT